MSTQHTPTPGPWTVDGAGTRAMVRGADLTIVAVRHRLAGEIHEANCHLIAAAPDMYDALKSMRAYLSKCPPHSEDRTGAEWGRMMDLSGAALARAEGKS